MDLWDFLTEHFWPQSCVSSSEELLPSSLRHSSCSRSLPAGFQWVWEDRTAFNRQEALLVNPANGKTHQNSPRNHRMFWAGRDPTRRLSGWSIQGSNHTLELSVPGSDHEEIKAKNLWQTQLWEAGAEQQQQECPSDFSSTSAHAWCAQSWLMLGWVGEGGYNCKIP